MSLAIEVDNVRAELLGDGWHEVAGDSFEIDAYEYVNEGTLLHGGGESRISASGFAFVEEREGLKPRAIAGPLSAILAVRY